MRALTRRLRALERRLPHFDASGFTADEFVELTRLIVARRFDIRLNWSQAYFLTHVRSANRSWCRYPDPSPLEARAWFVRHEAAIHGFATPAAPDDVIESTGAALQWQLGLWDHFVARPNWVWFFARAAVARGCHARPKPYASDADLEARFYADGRRRRRLRV